MNLAKKLLEKLKHNFFLKLLSVFVAFIMWMVVINTEDPITTVTIRNIPVSIENEEAIRESGKIPEVLDGETINVVVQARKSICDKLTKDDILAVANFEKLSITNTVAIDVSVKGYDDKDIEIIRGQNQYVKLSLDDYETKEFKVNVVTTGNPADGYVVASNVASPNVVTVSGSKTQLSKITEVVVTVDVSEKDGEFVSVVHPVAKDGNNDIVSEDKISISTNDIAVHTVIYITKEVTLGVNLIGEPNEDYEVTGVSVQPTKVTVAGPVSDLRRLKGTLTVDVNIEGATDSVEVNLNVKDLINKDLTSIISVGDSTVAVKVNIEKQGTKQTVLLPAEITLKNLADDCKAEITAMNQRVINVQSRKELLEELTAEDLGAYIDLSDFTESGIYENVPIAFDLKNGVKVLTDVTVTVTIEKDEKEEAQTE